MEKISIQTVPVTIRVMEVGGKRMTLAVFNQIQNGDFFSEEIADEDREACYIGWVSHKGEKYILFHIGGNLKKDKFEYRRTDKSLKIRLENERRNFEYWEKHSDRHPDKFEAADNALIKAKAEYDEDFIFCKELNNAYLQRFVDEAQIFIAI